MKKSSIVKWLLVGVFSIFGMVAVLGSGGGGGGDDGGAALPPDGSYSVAADGTLTIDEMTQGIVGLGGDFVVIADTDESDNEIKIDAMIKKSVAADNSLLSGIFITNQFSRTASSGNYYAEQHEIEFDGNGNFTGGPPDITTYSVSATGVLTIGDFKGMVLADGSVFILTDDDTGDDRIFVVALKKPGSGMNDASITGTYQIYTIAYDTEGAGKVLTSITTGTSTGNGVIDCQVVSQSNDASAAGTTFSFDYTVAPDGTFTNLTSLDEGIINTDGSLLVITDVDEDDDPQIVICVRESSGLSTSDLNGTYQGIEYEQEDPDSSTDRFQVVMDGAGGFIVEDVTE